MLTSTFLSFVTFVHHRLHDVFQDVVVVAVGFVVVVVFVLKWQAPWQVWLLFSGMSKEAAPSDIEGLRCTVPAVSDSEDAGPSHSWKMSSNSLRLGKRASCPEVTPCDWAREAFRVTVQPLVTTSPVGESDPSSQFLIPSLMMTTC